MNEVFQVSCLFKFPNAFNIFHDNNNKNKLSSTLPSSSMLPLGGADK